MSFKIKNNVINLSSHTSPINFSSVFKGYSRSQTSPLNCSFTDDQGFLWDTKGVSVISTNRGMCQSTSRTGSDGLPKRIYRTGQNYLCNSYHCWVNSWTENNSNVTVNIGGISCFGICADGSNHTATNYYCRQVYDSVFWGASVSLLTWTNYSADGCLKSLVIN